MTEVSPLNRFSNEELRAELLRRQKSIPGRPKPIVSPNFTRLIFVVTQGVEQLVQEQFEDEDFKHSVYEEALTAIYGKEYFKWRNSLGF